MDSIRLFTIGSNEKSARHFFETLREARVRRVIDVRLNNTSQLAGFAKKDDLRYFLQTLLAIEYVHLPELAPTRQILDAFKKLKGSWLDYERDFLALLRSRRVEHNIAKETFHEGCLLCSEHLPRKCHRRLAAEYLQARWGNVEVIHLT